MAEDYDPDMDVVEALRLGLVVLVEGTSQPKGEALWCGVQAPLYLMYASDPDEPKLTIGCTRQDGHAGSHVWVMRWTETLTEAKGRRLHVEAERARQRIRTQEAEQERLRADAEARSEAFRERERERLSALLEDARKPGALQSTLDGVLKEQKRSEDREWSRVQINRFERRRKDVGKIKGPR